MTDEAKWIMLKGISYKAPSSQSIQLSIKRSSQSGSPLKQSQSSQNQLSINFKPNKRRKKSLGHQSVPIPDLKPAFNRMSSLQKKDRASNKKSDFF